MKYKLSALVCGVLLYSLTPGYVFALTRIVPDEFAYIQSAINASEPGDTVYVRAGTYIGNLVMKDQVDLIGDGPENTTLRMTNQYLEAANDGRIEGFTIIGRGIRCNNKSPLITNNVITGADSYGIWVTGNSWPTIFKNLIYNNLGGINTNGLATILNNTIVDNLAGYGISTVYDYGYRVENNLVVGHDLGIAGYYRGNYEYTGGYNNSFRSRRSDYYRVYPNTGDISLDPLLTKAPEEGMLAWRADETATGWDTVYVQYDWSNSVLIGDNIEICYDRTARQVTEVEYGTFYGYAGTRIRFSPALSQSPGGAIPILNWKTEADLGYDFTYLAGSPNIDAGNPDPAHYDLDGSINDIGAVGGATITPVYDPIPPAAITNVAVTRGDTTATIDWSAPADADLRGYMILRSDSGPITGTPIHSQTYNVGS